MSRRCRVTIWKPSQPGFGQEAGDVASAFRGACGPWLFSGYGLQLSDLIQEGNIGLMKAVKRFDPDQGVRLVSFAVHWIRAEMHEFILKNWRIVKVATTKAQRKLFFNLRKSKKRLGWMNAAEVSKVALDLGVPEAYRARDGIAPVRSRYRVRAGRVTTRMPSRHLRRS